MTFAQAFQACLRRWWIPLILVAVAVGAVSALHSRSTAQKPQYTASSIQLVNPAAGQSSPVNLPEAQLEVKVGQVPVAAAKILKYHSNPITLAAIPQVSIDPTVGTLTITVNGPDPASDAHIANAFANALNLHLTQAAVDAYQSQLNNLQNQMNSLQSQISQYELKTDPISQAKVGGLEDQFRVAYDQFQQLSGQGAPPSAFTFLQHAVPVRAGASGLPRSRLAQALVAGIVALLIGLGIAILLELLRPRIRDRVDAEREFGCPVLAEVPRLSRKLRRRFAEVGVDDYRLGAYRESYRMLRTAILLQGAADTYRANGQIPSEGPLVVSGPQVILVTSGLAGEGKSTTVANLAVAMAESGRQVLVCDADFRAPTVHQSFGLGPGPGLTDLITDPSLSGNLADLVHPTTVPGVSLVHGGASVDNAAELVATKGARLLEQARSLADVVIMDTAPLLVVSDASELLPDVDAVVIVARVHRTTRESARRTFELLDRAEIPVLGVVLVGTQSPGISYYGRQYGYAYGYQKGMSKRRHRWFVRLRDRDIVRVDAGSRRPPDVDIGNRQPGPEDPEPEELAALDELENAGPPTAAGEVVGASESGSGNARHSRQEPGRG
jgi:capsular exopolysaccharide synthesis family protein